MSSKLRPHRGQLAYWFWDHVPGDDEIDEQLEGMQRSGLTGLQIQARLSLPIEEYMDDSYLRAAVVATTKAAERGLEIGFYDEYAWQSGSAGGRVTAGAPGLAESFIFWAAGQLVDHRLTVKLEHIETSSADLGEAGLDWHLRGGVLEWGGVRLLGILPCTGGFLECELVADEVANRERILAAAFTLPGGAALAELEQAISEGGIAVIAATAITSRVINYLSPAAVDKFVQDSHGRFLAAFDNGLPDNVTHVFYDQPHPNSYTWTDPGGMRQRAHPYSDEMWKSLGETDTPTRSDAIGVITAKCTDPSIREKWHAFYSDFAIRTFFGPLRHWCDEHGLLLTGHEVLGHVGGWQLDHAFREWDLLANFGLDYYTVGSWRHITAIDIQDTNPQLSPILGRSVARRHGSRELWAEIYLAGAEAGTGQYVGAWDLRAGAFRNALLRAALQGVTRFILHGYYLTDGHFDPDCRPFDNLRYDFPPGFNYLPWYEEVAPELFAEVTALQELIDGSERVCAVELVYPLHSIWRHGRDCLAARAFSELAEALDRGAIDFHVVEADQPVRGLRLEPQDEAGIVTITATDDERVIVTDVSRALQEASRAGQRVARPYRPGQDPLVPHYCGHSQTHQVFACHNTSQSTLTVRVPSAGIIRLRTYGGFAGPTAADAGSLGSGVAVGPGQLLLLEYSGAGTITWESLPTPTGYSHEPDLATELPLREFVGDGFSRGDDRIAPPVRRFQAELSEDDDAILQIELPPTEDAFLVQVDGERLGLSYEGGRRLTMNLPHTERGAMLEIRALGGAERHYYGNTKHADVFVSDWLSSIPRIWMSTRNE